MCVCMVCVHTHTHSTHRENLKMSSKNEIEKCSFADNKIHIYRCYQQRLTFILFAQTKIHAHRVLCAKMIETGKYKEKKAHDDGEKN